MTDNRIRWRIIPAALVMLTGGLNLWLSCICLTLQLFGFELSDVPASRPQQFVGISLILLSSILWMFAGRCWWRGAWIAAVTSTLIGYGLGAFGASHAWM